MKRALITGINGQDGSYLAELLLNKGFEVHGLVRREALEDRYHRLSNIASIKDRVRLHIGSVDNHLSIYKVVAEVRPDQCYHLAASSFVSYAFDDEGASLATNFSSTHFLLSSLKELAPDCRFYLAGSSEMFGEPNVTPQDETTRFNPRSIYGISKVASHHLVTNYRSQHGMFACTGILYNHESPRRKYEFVTRKISSTVARIHCGLADRLELGNLNASRDWGYAPDYVDAMQRMLEHDTPDDYVIATGNLHSVEEFVEIAFAVVSMDYRNYVAINPEYYRPEGKTPLVGNCAKSSRVLGWQPHKPLQAIIEEMVLADIRLLESKT